MLPIRTIRLAARLATGSTYATLGLDAARNPGPRVGMAASTLAVMRKVAPLPGDDEQIVRANGAVQALAGAVLVSGRCQQISAIALIASLIPTTAAGHAFWNIEDPLERKMQRTQFHKNIAMIGGLLFAIGDDAS